MIRESSLAVAFINLGVIISKTLLLFRHGAKFQRVLVSKTLGRSQEFEKL